MSASPVKSNIKARDGRLLRGLRARWISIITSLTPYLNICTSFPILFENSYYTFLPKSIKYKTMPENISKGTQQSQLEALTYAAGAQFESHPYYYASPKDLERELRRDDKQFSQPSVPTKAIDKTQREPRNEEEQARHLHNGVRKSKHGGNKSSRTARLDPLPRLQCEGDHDMYGKPSGALAYGSRNTSSKEAQRKHASSLGYISGNDYKGEP